jgi:membrane-associated protease RseP (regulator of RpoE activity)
MDTLIYLGGAIAFFGLVMASIALHEIGHLVPESCSTSRPPSTSSASGAPCGRASRRDRVRGQGHPAGRLRPLRRHVPAEPNRPGQVRATRTGIFQTMADNARAAEWETIRPEDDGRLFYQKKSWQKLIIMAGGPTMNLLLAF